MHLNPNAAFQRGKHANIKDAAEEWQQKRVWSSADATQFELERISADIADRSGCVLISNGTKSVSSATRKVKGQCNGHWLEIGDIARVTLAAERQDEADKAIRMVEGLSTSEGFSWMKREPKDAATDPCGYSGWNGVLRFGRKPISAVNPIPKGKRGIPGYMVAPQLRTHMTEDQIMTAMAPKAEVEPLYVGRTAEIQVNTYDLLYGKMSQEDYVAMFGPARWKECETRFGVEGGLGHLFYEDYRVDKESERGKYIAHLSKRYYARTRGTHPKPTMGVDQLKEELVAYMEIREAETSSVKYKKGPDGRWAPAGKD